MGQKNGVKFEVRHGNIRKRIYGILKLIIFLAILIICLIIIDDILKRKDTEQTMADFFSQENDFDVLFFGSSHVRDGIYPMKLWNDYGIVSYNLSKSAERIATTYYSILLTLEATNPQLIVVDTYCIFDNQKFDNHEKTHGSLDAYKISLKKYMAIKDLFDEENLLETEMEYLFSFSLYHSRWNELTEEDFENISKYEKGAESKINIAIPSETSNFDDVEIYSGEENINMEYLRKIIEYCKENNIEILLTYLPYIADDDQISQSKYVQQIADEYDVNYINFLSMDLVNYNTDLFNIYDSNKLNGHLNVSGARKVTDYIGQYIMANYDIEDQRENEEYSFWYEDYDEYIDMKISNLKSNNTNLNNYLMLLYEEYDISYEIKISSTLEIEDESVLQQLLENLGNNYEINDSVFVEQEEKTIQIKTWDNRTGEEIGVVWF